MRDLELIAPRRAPAAKDEAPAQAITGTDFQVNGIVPQENDMDPQTVEGAVKRCIDVSTRLGALEDEVSPRPAASSSGAWTKSTKSSDGSQAANEPTDGWFGRSAPAGRRTGSHEECRTPASGRQKPKRRHHRDDTQAPIP